MTANAKVPPATARRGSHPATGGAVGAMSAGQVAALLGMTRRTVTQLIDAGEIPGWRMPKGDRRAARADVEAFARRHGIPLAGSPRVCRAEVLLVGLADDAVAHLLGSAEAADGRRGFVVARSAFECGWRLAREGFALVVAGTPGLSPAELRGVGAGLIRPALAGTRLVAVLPEDGGPPVAGACETLVMPATAADVAAAVGRALAGREPQ